MALSIGMYEPHYEKNSFLKMQISVLLPVYVGHGCSTTKTGFLAGDAARILKEKVKPLTNSYHI